jgi:hypothetical protein
MATSSATVPMPTRSTTHAFMRIQLPDYLMRMDAVVTSLAFARVRLHLRETPFEAIDHRPGDTDCVARAPSPSPPVDMSTPT